jgi:riboflavin synthase
MFTGIIDGIDQAAGISRRSGGMSLQVELGQLAEGVRAGDSIAVNGVCLTAAALNGTKADFDVSKETLGKTTLKEIRPGAGVNLERAMAADGRFGGHIVQGHIDGVGRIAAIRKDGEFAVFTIEPPAELMDEIIVKGSIAIDGISLTVAAVRERSFDVALIPQTLSRSTWGKAVPGQAVNIETDILIKAVRKQLQKMIGPGGLTEQRLKETGF